MLEILYSIDLWCIITMANGDITIVFLYESLGPILVYIYAT